MVPRPRRPTGRSRKPEIPDVYSQMIAEETPSQSLTHDRSRPLKKRKTRAASPVKTREESDRNVAEHQKLSVDALTIYGPREQIVYDDSTEPSAASDYEFEDVVLEAESNPQALSKEKTVGEDLSIELDPRKQTPSKAPSLNRLPNSRIERQKRLDVHKVHLCCLLVHVYIRNAWCNDRAVQANLRPLLNERIIPYLNPDQSFSQFRRSETFKDGLQQAMDTFQLQFSVGGRGLRRAHWRGAGASEKTPHLRGTGDTFTKAVFLKAARDFQGSADTGAQLFCALLRSVGVDTRLVCSLQPLPFTSAAPTQAPRGSKATVYAEDHGRPSAQAQNNVTRSRDTTAELSDTASDSMPKRVKRFGQSSARSSTSDLGQSPSAPVKSEPLPSSSYPLYWVEVFNDAHQKWIPIDPLITKTIGKTSKLEPPANDSLNNMSYVVAFEDDRTCRDVTRRYTKAYNAKTRRSRLESSKGGAKWWKKALKTFDDGLRADRDDIEQAELANFEASEPMPRNVQDFKDHPYYALERHLRRNEVISPKKQVGKITTGKASGMVEPIYRRQDVRSVKSADKWYREGRIINQLEQPLKHHTPSSKRVRRRSPSFSGSDSEKEDSTVGLYALEQTTFYIPPPVTDGHIPRNTFGNLDIYTSTMIPRGGVHVRAREGVQSARILGIDFVEAVVGFEFKARKGTPVKLGVVVARDYAEAMAETVTSLRILRKDEDKARRAKLAVRLWKRFLAGMRVMERVRGYAEEEGQGQDAVDLDVRKEVDDEETANREAEIQGGFFPHFEPGTGAKSSEIDSHKDFRASEATAASINDFDTFEREVLAGRLSELDREGADMCIFSPWDEQIPQHLHPPLSQDQLGREDDVGGGGFTVSDEHEDHAGSGGFLLVDESEIQGGGFIPEDPVHGLDGTVEVGGFARPAATNISSERDRDIDSLRISDEKATTETAMYGVRTTNTYSADKTTANPTTDKMEPPIVDIGGQVEDSSTALADEDVLMSGALNPSHLPFAATFGSDRRASGPVSEGSNKSVQNHGDDDDNEEVSSLLSHDPEDEDAEPDWL